jgi:hypothetical protein
MRIPDVNDFIKDPPSYLRARAVQYGASRYLEKASLEQLDNREKHLYANIWTTYNDGSVREITNPGRREFFFSKIIELEVERKLRLGSRGNIQFDEAAIMDLACRSYTPVRPRIPPSLLTSPFLVRYSEIHFINDALSNGILKITPASRYNDSSLNSAQYDDELRHFAVTPRESIPFKLIGRTVAGGPEVTIPHRPLELFRFMEVPNFYVFCCAASFDCRMFNDFKADAALIIHGVEEFIKRVGHAVAQRVPSTFLHQNVRYYDPYAITRPSELIPAFSKNFSYAYQDEYRLVWKPSSETELEPFFINIGPMNDIAAMVEL